VPGLGETLHGSPVDHQEVQRVRDALLFEGPERQKRLVRFWVLLVVATAIATYGLIGDAVATIIGAMIVAPLMIPIMGLAFGISIGERKAIASSFLVGLGGILTSIAVGYLLALPFSHTLDPTQVPQIMQRTQPHLVDLLAALATGLAGAFAVGRSDVSDTLPGVAIAISLVPPLANVGILLAVKRPDLASGSMLLFVTNYLAIVVTGSLVFGVMGFSRVVFDRQASGTRRLGIAVAIALTAVLLVPLSAASYNVAITHTAQTRAVAATESWLAGTDYRVVSSETSNTVLVVVQGNGPMPPVAQLQSQLKGRLYGRPVSIESVPASVEAFPTQ
jgi:uncharacterized hydrophobic protein (TIGR00271 family)